MKRLSFLATLFGVGAAGQTQKCIPPSSTVTMPNGKRVCLAPGGAEPHIYMNNECPTCGTMAKPYVREMYDAHHGLMVNCRGSGDGRSIVCDPPKMVPYGPAERVTRCFWCNAAFWQDAEEKTQ